MSVRTIRTPSYRLHKPTGRAVVTLCGRDLYLGEYGTRESRAEYDRIIGEWLANGRTLPGSGSGNGADVTNSEMLLAFLAWAETYYVKNGRMTNEVFHVRYAIKPIRELYGDKLARDFGPLQLKTVRQAIIETGICRSEVNRRVRIIVRGYKWAVAEGMIPPSIMAYVDWSQQEFGIAASLSGDEAMMDAYRSGDPYLAFGKQAGRIPADGTKQSHAAERDLFKACVLGVQYGMGVASLACRIGKSSPYAVELLRLHRETYPKFWAWSDGAESHAMLLNRLHTVFGWTVRIGSDANPRSLRNFPCQANGAEMLRLACCLAMERGVSIVAPIHDAVLIEGLEWEIDDAVAETQAAMAEASAVILDGFRLRSEAKIARWPDRYMDGRGREFWGRVMSLLMAKFSSVVKIRPVAFPGFRRLPGCRFPALLD